MKKPTKALKRRAWNLFSKYIRHRDNYVCFTCGVKGDKYTTNAGHFIHKDCLDFDEQNINCQCIRCNKYLSGNRGIYANNLIKKYGLNIVDKLIRKGNIIKKFTQEELLQIIEKYKSYVDKKL